MNPLQRRLKALIARVGDSFTVGGSSRKGVFGLLGVSRAKDLLPAGTVDALGRPLRVATVAYDDATAASDTVTWDGADYTVEKVLKVRWRDSTVARVLVLSPV